MKNWSILIILLTTLTACVTETKRSTYVPPINQPKTLIPEAQVLDVGVAILDPGIAELTDDEAVYPEIRRAEATFIAKELAKTLEEVTAWGAVRVVPDGEQFTDLLIKCKILHSDGEHIELEVNVTDATGRQWIDKSYEDTASIYAYTHPVANQDPFLVLYRQIANDMLLIFNNLTTQERESIRQVAELRFARNFAEDSFANYLAKDNNGKYKIQRLPAENDPMLERVRNLRQRNYVFVDTLQGYYTGFSEEMYSPYQEWRKVSFEEVVAEREAKAEANRELIAGAAAVIAGIAAQSSSSDYANAAGIAGIAGGGYLLKSGMQKRSMASIHSAAIQEMGQSLSAEITPRVIELEDRTVQLSGSVEDQYGQWRELMADIYATEIGALDMPDDQGTDLAPDNSETD